MKSAQALKAGCIQLSSGPDIEQNLKLAAALVREAAGQGAQLIATPENTCHIRVPQSEKVKSCPVEAEHPALPLFSDLARDLGVCLVLGSISVKLESGKIANRSYVFDAHGAVVGQYDKIHLFDVDLPTGEKHRESEAVQAGDKAVVVDTSFARLGLSICYDLRFAALYRKLAQAGAEILLVPSAFTVPTGKAHWEVLLRARAIETGSFVMAPAQDGTHEGGRKTYGHSMVVGPWGEILAERSAPGPGVLLADLNLADSARARTAIPALKHDRAFSLSGD